MFQEKNNGFDFWLMWQILLWCQMTTPNTILWGKEGFIKVKIEISRVDTYKWLCRTCFLQLLLAYIADLDWQTLEKYIHRSTEPVILDLWLACGPYQTIIIKYTRNVPYLLRAGDNSTSAVKHRPRKHSALLNGAWTQWSRLHRNDNHSPCGLYSQLSEIHNFGVKLIIWTSTYLDGYARGLHK